MASRNGGGAKSLQVRSNVASLGLFLSYFRPNIVDFDLNFSTCVFEHSFSACVVVSVSETGDSTGTATLFS